VVLLRQSKPDGRSPSAARTLLTVVTPATTGTADRLGRVDSPLEVVAAVNLLVA
jgi:hypothetical protein